MGINKTYKSNPKVNLLAKRAEETEQAQHIKACRFPKLLPAKPQRLNKWFFFDYPVNLLFLHLSILALMPQNAAL